MRQRRPGIWEMRVRTGRDPLTGHYGQVSRSFRGTKREAEFALARLVTEVEIGDLASIDQTVGELLDRWVDHLEVLGRTPKTIDGYRSLIRARLRPALGTVELRKLTPGHLDILYKALLGTGLSPTYVRHCHAALSTALRQAVKWGWIARSPAERATPPGVPHFEIQPPTPDEVGRLITMLEESDPDMATLLYVAATTGCRRGELCGLQWSDLDMSGGTLTVRRAITDTSRGVQAKDPKTHRSRRIALDASTVIVLRTHRERMVDRARTCEAVLADNAYVWSQDADGSIPYRPNRVTDAFRRLRQKVGLEHIDFHHLRHFAATTLAGAGIDVRTIAGRLGHANPAITLRTYAHFMEAADRQAANVMGRLELPIVASSEAQVVRPPATDRRI
jgi:integrase